MENRESQYKRFLTSLPKQVIAILVLAAIGGVYPMAVHTSRETNIALITGTLMSTANVLLGYAAIEYSIGKSYTTFFKVVLGGMVIRMAVLLGGFFICIKVFRLPIIPLSASLLSFYGLYLILEVIFIHLRVRTKNI